MNQNEEILSEGGETAENLAASQETPDATSENSQDGQVLRLQAELAEQKDKFIRLYSEFENFRRRTAKEKLEMIQSANEQLLKAFLAVADDFERAEKSFKDKNDKDLEGFSSYTTNSRRRLNRLVSK